ncbi:metacaspase-9-like isoform X2 [Hibiscus syriacus]|uniref:metacaspase-9-like isoform X2 n=1 Tax=Hibiscus syriacus TaxID=106335 RepID=UPI0019213246|nr:metacaspase-9-like isoform X2 [Hibiscus syriacus]
MVKRAVLVGCTYNETRFSLYGCINDVSNMNTLIVQRLGFLQENVKVLTDPLLPEATIPTGENIRDALSEMVKSAGAGDVLLFYFSGHGTAIPVYVPGQPYREEKAIVSCDLDLITRMELKELVDQLPGGSTLTIVADSSYGGGLATEEKKHTDSNILIPFPTSHAKLIRKSIDFNIIRQIRSVASYPINDQATESSSSSSPDDGILLSGCDANETSFDVVLGGGGGRPYGAFTNALLKVLTRNRGESLENSRLVYGTRKKLMEDGIGVDQNPCLYCSHGNANKHFLGGFVYKIE